MDEKLSQEAPKMSQVESDHEEFEMSHTDKLVGVFSEPGKTFTQIAKFPLKTADWIIPVCTLIVVSILSIVVLFSNPQIKLQAKQEGEKRIQKMVETGTIRPEAAEQQIEVSNKFFDSPLFYVITSVQALFASFIMFFIVSGVFLLFTKLVLKGEGTYKSAMIAYGLPYYILIIQGIVTVIIAFLMGKILRSTSVAEFVNVDKLSIVHWILGRLDVLSIWFYVVVGIGFAKLFNSKDTKKYIIMILSLWIGFSLIFFVLAKSVPFFSFLAG